MRASVADLCSVLQCKQVIHPAVIIRFKSFIFPLSVARCNRHNQDTAAGDNVGRLGFKIGSNKQKAVQGPRVTALYVCRGSFFFTRKRAGRSHSMLYCPGRAGVCFKVDHLLPAGTGLPKAAASINHLYYHHLHVPAYSSKKGFRYVCQSK